MRARRIGHDVTRPARHIAGPRARAIAAGRRRSGGGFLSRQDHDHADRDLAGRRLRPARAAGRPPHGPPHPGRADHRAAQHAGRGRLAGRQLARHRWRRATAPSLHAIMQNMSAHQALGGASVEFDTRKFFWIGNTTDTPNVINSWHTTGIQHHPGRHGARARGRRARHRDVVGLLSEGDERARRHQVQDRVRLSRRQRRQPGDGARRGRRRGSNSWASWKSTKPHWLREKKIFILVQIALKRHPELADVPL